TARRSGRSPRGTCSPPGPRTTCSTPGSWWSCAGPACSPTPSRTGPSTRVSGREPLALLIIGAAALVVSGIAPHDRTTWVLEVAPALIAAPVLIATARRFPLTPLAYRLIFLHALILMVGGHYTYAEVPAGFWVEHALGLSRNPYDRLGHLA